MNTNNRLWRWLGLIFVLSFGALGYLAMTAMSALSLALALLLGRMWDGGVLPIAASES